MTLNLRLIIFTMILSDLKMSDSFSLPSGLNADFINLFLQLCRQVVPK